MRRTVVASSLLLSTLVGGNAAPAADRVDYLRDIKPILQARCYPCHGSLQQKAKLRLDTAELMRKGGKHGPAIVAGKSGDSLLILRVTASDGAERMPPETEGAPLSAGQIALLKAWIDQGATAPREAIPEDPRNHWAYQTPVRPALPKVRNAGWVRNPIDAFVAAERDRRGLQPQPAAEKEVLLRRVYLDLIGVPPTRDDLHTFLTDPSSDAYDKVVDRLLASPLYGQRWGRHWMDIWRYSDWYGRREVNEQRNSQRHIWRWRDWIIESLNKDKGYDRMIVEMLAADEVAPTDQDTLRATGYLGRNYYIFNRTVWLQDTVEFTGMSFLGMTFKCCRCHDHKYDPLAQKEYYRFRAFFEPHNVRTDQLPGKAEKVKELRLAKESSTLKDGFDRIYDADLQAVTYLLERGDEKRPVKDAPLQPGLPEVVSPGKLDVQPVSLPVEAYYPDLRPFRQKELLAAAQEDVDKAQAALALAKQASVPGAKPAKPPVPTTKVQAAVSLAEKVQATAQANQDALQARIAAEKAKYGTPPDPKTAALVLAAGKAESTAAVRKAEEDLLRAEQQLTAAREALKPGDAKLKQAVAAAEQQVAAFRASLQTAQKAAAKPSPSYKPLGPVYPSMSSGRRLALARWIASKENPLTARVAVNHIWLRHMGAPFVGTVYNFGPNGKRPTHPALLDWLAVELMDSGWSMKHLHRLIVTSNTYRMQSAAAGPSDPNLARDPENQYLWRMNYRRMEAEVVRDSMLYLAGQLDTAGGGPDLDPASAESTRRRSVYYRHTPDDSALFLQMFDAANPAECYRRTESVMPQQALALANSGLSLTESKLLAQRLAQQCAPAMVGNDAAFVSAAFEEVLGRAPTAEERARCETFLRRQAHRSGPPTPAVDARSRARESLVHVLFNHNDFVTIR